jgi:hypothetical protein
MNWDGRGVAGGCVLLDEARVAPLGEVVAEMGLEQVAAGYRGDVLTCPLRMAARELAAAGLGDGATVGPCT